MKVLVNDVEFDIKELRDELDLIDEAKGGGYYFNSERTPQEFIGQLLEACKYENIDEAITSIFKTDNNFIFVLENLDKKMLYLQWMTDNPTITSEFDDGYILDMYQKEFPNVEIKVKGGESC